MKSINSRINDLIKNLGITKNDFAKEIGVSSAMISKITTQEVNFSVDIYKKIVNTYQSVNEKWLLFGEGDMWPTNPKNLTKPNILTNANHLDNKKEDLLNSGSIKNIVSIHKEYADIMSCIIDIAYVIFNRDSNYFTDKDFETFKFLDEYTLSKVFDVLQGKLSSEKYVDELQIYLTVAKNLLMTLIRDFRAIANGFEPGIQFAGSVDDLYKEYLERNK